MAITRTPIVDDDGSGTTGTVLDNAWKTEFYNQIDGAVAANPPPIVLAHGNGTNAAPAAANIAQVNFAAGSVALFDTIVLEVETFYLGNATPISAFALAYVSGATVTQLVRLDLVGAGISNGMGSTWRVDLRGWDTDTAVFIRTVGGGATGANVMAQIIAAGIVGWANVAWSLVLQHNGVPAGGNLIWKWSVTQHRR